MKKKKKKKMMKKKTEQWNLQLWILVVCLQSFFIPTTG